MLDIASLSLSFSLSFFLSFSQSLAPSSHWHLKIDTIVCNAYKSYLLLMHSVSCCALPSILWSYSNNWNYVSMSQSLPRQPPIPQIRIDTSFATFAGIWYIVVNCFDREFLPLCMLKSCHWAIIFWIVPTLFSRYINFVSSFFLSLSLPIYAFDMWSLWYAR